MDGRLPDGRVRRDRPLPPRARAPLCVHHRHRAISLSAGHLHGALRLRRFRRRARRAGVGRGHHRHWQWALSLLPGADGVTEHVAVPFWLAALVAAFALWALYEHVLMPALRWMV